MKPALAAIARDVVGRELVGRLGEDRFARREPHDEIEARDRDDLCALRDEERVDAALAGVVVRDVLERARVELSVEFAVDAREQVLVERRRQPDRVVVRALERRGVLLEVGAEQQPVAGAQRAGERAQQRRGLRRFVVADV